MTVDVAEAQIKVGLSDEGAIAGLRRVEAAYDRTMENIRHQRAVAQVDADLKPLLRKAEVAKAEVRKLAAQRAAVLITADVEPLERKVREAKARVKALSAEKATILAEMPTAHLERDAKDAKAAVDRIKALRARVIIDAGIRPLEEKVAEAKQLVTGFEDAKKLIATFDGNIEPFERKLAEARARVKEFEGRIASGEVVVEYDEDGYSEAMAELAALRASVKVADGERATVELAVRGNTADLDRALDQARNDFHKAQVDLNDAEIRISGDLTPLDNDLAEAEAHVKKTTATLSTTKVAIAANISDLDHELTRAKAEVAEAEAEWADVSVEVRAKTAELDAALAKAQAEVAVLDGQVAEVEVRVKGDRAALDELAAVRHERDQAAMAAERLAAAADKALLTDSNARRRLSLDHANALKMDMKRQQLLDSEPLKVAKAQAQVTRLYNEYTKATKVVERLSRARVPLGREGRAEHVAAVAGARAKLELLKAQLNALGANPPVEIKVDTDIDRGRIKRRMFLAKESMKGVLDKLGSLGDLTARIGPFTASIKQIGLALAVLGPTITDLIGGAGALVGVLGTGIAGAASVGAGALLGFGQAGLGLLMSIKPVITEFKTLNQLSAAATKAQLKYGASSKQAKAANQQMAQALKGVSPTTRRAFTDLTKLRTAWQKATGPTANRTFGHMLAEGVKTAGALLPQFAAQTNKALNGLDKGTSKWMRGLRSAEGRGILDNTFSNANKSLGPLMSGLGSLATMLGRIASSASNFLPGLSKGFAHWAQGLADGVSNGARVDAVIQRLVHHMQDLGHWAMSLGRLLTTVFNGGADAGDKMVQHMTASFDRWNADLKANGGKGLRDFFARAVKGTEALASALAPVIRAFIGLSTNLSPFVTGIFQGVGAVGKLANALLDMTALKGPVQALGFSLAAAFSITRIGKFIDLVMRAGQLVREVGLAKGLGMIAMGKGGIFGGPAAGLSGTLAAKEIEAAMISGGANAAAEIRAALIQGGMAAAGEESAAISGSGALAGAVGGVSKGGVLPPKAAAGAAAAEGMVAAEGAATAFSGAGLTAAAASTALSLGITAVGAAALYGGYKLLTMKSSTEKLHDRFKELDKGVREGRGGLRAYGAAAAQLPLAMRDYARSVAAAATGKRRLNALERQGKRNTQEYRDVLSSVNDQIRQRVAAHQRAAQLQSASLKADAKAQGLTEKLADAQRNVKDAIDARAQAVGRAGNPRWTPEANQSAKARAYAAATGDVTAALAKQENVTRALREAEAVRNSTLANQRRVLSGMIELTGKQQFQVGRLAKAAPNAAVKVATKFVDPIDAGAVAAAARRSLGKGVSVRTVNKIVADSSDVDQAIARLKAARITSKWRVIEQGGKAALALAERLNGKRRLSDARKRIITNGGPQALREIGKIDRQNVRDKSFYINARDGGVAGQVAAIIASARSVAISNPIHIPAVLDKPLGSKPKGSGARGRGGSFGDGAGSDYLNARASAQALRKPARRFATAGRVSTPTYLVGEEGTSEFVISSNPTYRRRNRGILAEAARTIGWPSGVRAARRGTASAPGLPSSIKTLPVPDPYVVGAIDVDSAATTVSALRAERDRRKAALANLRKSKAQEKSDWGKKDAKQKSKAAKQAHAKKMADFDSKHRDLVQGMNAKDTPDQLKTVSYASLVKGARIGGVQLKRLQHAKADIEHKASVIASDRTRMERDAAIYARPSSTPKQRADAKADYETVKKDRIATITHLVMALERAKGVAKKLSDMAPWSDQLRATLDGLTGSSEDAKTELDTSQNEPDATNVPDTADTFIERMGFTKTLKDDLLAAAKATTTATTTDDEAARQALFDLYGQQIIPAALADPTAKENTDLLTELYTAQGSYAPGAVDLTADQQALADQTKQRQHFAAVSGLIDKTFGYVTATMPGLTSGAVGGRAATAAMGGSAPAAPYTPVTLRDAAAQPRTSAGDAGAAPTSNVTVNFNALTANPQQARQAADVIVGGIGYQGGRPSSRTGMGA